MAPVAVVGSLLVPVIGTLAMLALIGPAYYAKYTGDLHLYIDASRRLLVGQLPYRDFPFEYPPLALIPLVLPRLLGGGAGMSDGAYVQTLAAQNILTGLIIAWTLGQIARQLHRGRIQPTWPTHLAPMGIFGALLALGAALAPFRFDLFPALLTVLALHHALKSHPAISGLLIGLAIAAKLYPLVMVPVFFLHCIANQQGTPQQRRRDALRFTIAVIASAGIIFGFMALAVGNHALDFLRYHQSRGLQLESLSGGFICLLHAFGIGQLRIATSFGASHLIAPAADLLLTWQLPIAAFAFACFLLLCWRRRQGEAADSDPPASRLIHNTASALLLFMLLSKVLSPQYFLWLMPFIALMKGRCIQIIYLLAWLTTLILFPLAYEQLKSLATGAILLLNFRNALLIYLLFIIIRQDRPPLGAKVNSSDFEARSFVGLAHPT